jgi:uncharacterized protein (TIGR02001 family)
MKMKQKIIAGAVALSAFAGFAVPAVHAEVAASVGAANMYYWRGHDLGGGAALIGDVNVSSNGFVLGAWTSSGDEVLGTEYDIYAGYSGSAGDFTYGISVINYVYPNSEVSPGDYVEIAPTLGYGPLKVTYYDAVNADHEAFSEDYSYLTVELLFEKFAFKYGMHDHKDDNSYYSGLSHIDLTYKYNDKLSFTLGKIIDDNEKTIDGEVINTAPDETNFVVTLSLPIL